MNQIVHPPKRDIRFSENFACWRPYKEDIKKHHLNQLDQILPLFIDKKAVKKQVNVSKEKLSMHLLKNIKQDNHNSALKKNAICI